MSYYLILRRHKESLQLLPDGDKPLIPPVYSTFRRSDGSLLYTDSESDHNMKTKVPDYKFICMGKYRKE